MEDTKDILVKKINDKYDEVILIYKKLYFPDTFTVRETMSPSELKNKLDTAIREYVDLTGYSKTSLLKELGLECEIEEFLVSGQSDSDHLNQLTNKKNRYSKMRKEFEETLFN